MAISSRQNPIVARYRAAAHGESADVMLLDGVHLVADAIAAGVRLREAAVTVTAEDDAQVGPLVTALGRARVQVTTVTTAVMDALSPVRSSSAIVALADRRATETAAAFRGAPALAIVAVDVQDPGNLGAIVRVAEAGGATGVVAAGACADPFGWKALRGSMGSAMRTPIAVVADVKDAMAAARQAGCRLLAAVPRDGRPLFDAPLDGSLAILVGGEGRGLPEEVVDAADDRITIPMAAPVESLNVAVTVALLVYEARRRRRRGVELGIGN